MNKKKNIFLAVFAAFIILLILCLRYIFGTWNFTCVFHSCIEKSIIVPTLSVQIKETATLADIQKLITTIKSEGLQIGNDDINVIAKSHFFYVMGVEKENEDDIILKLRKLPLIEQVEKVETIK